MTDRAPNETAGPQPPDRKTLDRALILPLVGFILLMPPVAGIFRLDTAVAGLPLTLVYVFAVWALLIAGAARLASRLRESLDAPDAAEDPEDAA